MNFAIIGASGNVGRKTIEILEKSKIKIDNLFFNFFEKIHQIRKRRTNRSIGNNLIFILILR